MGPNRLEAGYWVRVEKVYMEQFGLLQRRKRVLVVGNLEERQFAFPLRRAPKKSQASFFEQEPRVSILDAIGDLPPASDSGVVRYDRRATNEYQARMRCADGRPVRHHRAKPVNDVTRERIRALVEGATMKALPEHLRHPSFTKRAFRRVMDGTPTEKRGGAPAGLKRLVGAEPSLTITSAAPAEFVHPSQDRLRTLRNVRASNRSRTGSSFAALGAPSRHKSATPSRRSSCIRGDADQESRPLAPHAAYL